MKNKVTGRYWSYLIRNARIRNIEVKVTQEEAWVIFLKQNKRCVYTGIKVNGISIYKAGTASLDRKDSSLGYTKKNIQWVHKDVNRMKMNFKEKYFLKLCKLIARRFINAT
jgi:hypothetical protein